MLVVLRSPYSQIDELLANPFAPSFKAHLQTCYTGSPFVSAFRDDPVQSRQRCACWRRQPRSHVFANKNSLNCILLPKSALCTHQDERATPVCVGCTTLYCPLLPVITRRAGCNTRQFLSQGYVLDRTRFMCRVLILSFFVSRATPSHFGSNSIEQHLNLCFYSDSTS